MEGWMEKVISRRAFLAKSSMVAGAAIAQGSRFAWADDIDPRVADIVAKTVGIDTHNHIDLPLATADMPGPDIDLRGDMKRSGLSAICATFATDYQPGNSYERFRNGLAGMDRQLKRNHMKRSLTPADIRAAHKSSQPTVVQAVEGGHFLEGKIERVEEAYGLGLRLLGMVHDSDASVPLGDVYTQPPRFGGLTAFGASVVKECDRLGILIDLAHANVQTTQMALKVAKHPMIFSHTGLNTRLGGDAKMAQMMRSRLIGNEQAKMIADGGGAIGIWTHLSATPLEYAQNIRAMVDVIGVDHVVIGTDTKLTQAGPRPGAPAGNQPPRVGERTNGAWANETAGFYYVVVDAMLKTGFSPDDIGKIGGANFLRIFSESVKR
jgi:membrane dipeptidase